MKNRNVKLFILVIVSIFLLEAASFSFATDETQAGKNLNATDILDDSQDSSVLDSLPDNLQPELGTDIISPTSLEQSLSMILLNPSAKSNYEEAATFMEKNNSNGIKVFVDGKMIDFSKYNNVEPIVDAGRTLLPLRAIAETIGADVDWQPVTGTILLNFAGSDLQLKINSTLAQVNNDVKTLDVPPKILEGRTLVPLRFISEAFNKKVGWLPHSNKLEIAYIY